MPWQVAIAICIASRTALCGKGMSSMNPRAKEVTSGDSSSTCKSLRYSIWDCAAIYLQPDIHAVQFVKQIDRTLPVDLTTIHALRAGETNE